MSIIRFIIIIFIIYFVIIESENFEYFIRKTKFSIEKCIMS